MRIAVIAHNVRTGGGLVVAQNIIGALRRIADEHQFCVFVPDDAGYARVTLPTQTRLVRFRRTGYGSQWHFETVTLPRHLKAFRPDIILSLAGYAVKYRGATQAVLTMQPGFFYNATGLPAETPLNRVVGRLSRLRLMRSLPFVDLMLCQTPVAATRFRQAFCYTGPLMLMPPAVSTDLLPEKPSQPRPPAFPAGNPFVLFALARYYVHKNLEALVETVRRYGPALGDTRIVVTVAPSDHARAPRFLAMLDDPAIRPYFVNVGRLSAEELAPYYMHSDGVILPTFLESFSSTYLEAMYYRRPILTSDLDFARDNCGPAAFYFNPSEPESIRDAILALKTSPDLAASLTADGEHRRHRLANTWDDTVRTVIDTLLTWPDRSPGLHADAPRHVNAMQQRTL